METEINQEEKKIRQSSQGQERSVCQRPSVEARDAASARDAYVEARDAASARDAVLKPGTRRLLLLISCLHRDWGITTEAVCSCFY